MLFMNEGGLQRLQGFYIDTNKDDKYEKARLKAIKQRNEAFKKYKK
jgi:hypothetical protein